jgi:diaminopimelate epimerase
MKLEFYKYQGNGNDFILIDNRKKIFPVNDHILIKALCDRHFGIGADGLMLLEEIHGFEFRMVYYNSNGIEGSMCGNGGRCIVHFAKELGIIDNTASFSGIDGPHEGIIGTDGLVHLKMQDVDGFEKDGPAYVLNTGSPHYILYTDNIDNVNVVSAGKEIRNKTRYADHGINVNFVEITGKSIRIRTYERGVENETLACGTGSVAAALSLVPQTGFSGNSVRVETLGGNLEVSFKNPADSFFTDIWLTGPAKCVFKGWTDTTKFLH